jgi:hypothetical protein
VCPCLSLFSGRAAFELRRRSSPFAFAFAFALAAAGFALAAAGLGLGLGLDDTTRSTTTGSCTGL